MHLSQGALLRYFSSEGWQPEQHAAWPAAFRELVHTLVLCAHHRQPAGRDSSAALAGLQALPLPLLQSIVAAMAGRRTDWLPEAGAGGAAAGAPAP